MVFNYPSRNVLDIKFYTEGMAEKIFAFDDDLKPNGVSNKIVFLATSKKDLLKMEEVATELINKIKEFNNLETKVEKIKKQYK